MGEMVKIAVDAMGGDFAPQNIVQGVVDALKEDEDIFVYLVGKENEVNAELMKYEFDGNRVEVVNATEVIATEEPPVAAVRTKKDSSLVKALQLTKDGTADAFVSAGSSGAILVGGQLIVGRLRGVERSPFATFMPTLNGAKLILDCGANVDCRAEKIVDRRFRHNVKHVANEPEERARRFAAFGRHFHSGRVKRLINKPIRVDDANSLAF